MFVGNLLSRASPVIKIPGAGIPVIKIPGAGIAKNVSLVLVCSGVWITEINKDIIVSVVCMG